jgi:hypothetical protein
MQNVSILRTIGWGTAALLLLAPLIGMQFTKEINWTRADFATCGLMVILTGGAIEIAMRITENVKTRIISAVLLIGLFLLVFAELSVGLFH